MLSRHKVAFTVLFFSIVLSAFIVIQLPIQIHYPTGEKWLAGWSYRKAYALKTVSGVGVDYAVPIVVINALGTDVGNTTYTTKVLPNFEDVRFTDSDGDTELSYYEDVLNTGANTTFIVKVPRYLSESNLTIYMYYGNISGPVSTTTTGAATLARTCNYVADGMTGTWSTEAAIGMVSFTSITASNMISGTAVTLSCALSVYGDTISKYWYSWNNTGVWTNQTAVVCSSTSVAAQFSGTWNTTYPLDVSVKLYANDSSGTTYETSSNYTLAAQNHSLWLSGWTYRYEYTISRTHGIGTGYQIPFNVYYGDDTDDDSKFATFTSRFKWQRYPEVMSPTFSWEGYPNTKRANIADPDIIVESNHLAMYYTGFLPNDNGTIALATSPIEYPPRNWTKQGIIFQNNAANATAWDRAFVRLGSVVKVNGIYYMYYDGSDACLSGDAIGLATSTNGLNFTRYAGNPILSTSGTEKAVREASVIVVDGTWYMIYSHDDGSYPTLCHCLLATSTDGYTWTKQGAILAKGASGKPDDVYMEHHQLAYIYGRFVLTYDQYDGSTWSIGCACNTLANTAYTKLGTILVPSGVSGTFDRMHCATPFLFNNSDSWYMMYQGGDGPWETTSWNIGVVSKVYDGVNLYLHKKARPTSATYVSQIQTAELYSLIG